MPKYTEKDLLYKADTFFLPYINMVMKNIQIKKDTYIAVNSDGCIYLKSAGLGYILILFSDIECALNSKIYYNLENYEDFIELEEVIVMVETKELQFKKGK